VEQNAKMFRKYPLTARLAVFVVLPLLALAGAGAWRLHASLPQARGTVVVPGLAHEVRIERDAHGVPHIVAATDRDAYFALGYAHAQDRLWQLELQRRIARGRLSEVLGKATVEQDVWFRTLGLERSARDAWAALGADAKASLQAYADGVNRFLGGRPALPPEFALLGLEPEPWTVYDSLAWSKVFALSQGGNFRLEIERLLAGRLLAPERLAQLFPEYPATDAVAARDDALAGYARLADFQRALERDWRIGGRYVGSNAWAVAGRRTRDGATLLANDPHLGLQIPSQWYFASLRGDRLDVHGATLVGLPVVVFGRNASIAWGGTNLMADTQDLFFEQVAPDDASRYRAGDAWLSFETREETIAVAQEFPAFLRAPIRPLTIRVRRSRHGPLISDMFRVFEQPVALRWTALDADDTSYEAFYRLGYAHDWASFQDALRLQVAPALGMVYADRAGNIGFLAAGRLPVRASGEGLVPAAGWDGAHAWTGYVPFDGWARRYNPDEGWIVAANQRIVGDDYPYLIGRDFAPPARADRIAALLARHARDGTLDAAAMRGIQADTLSEPARRLLARLRAYAPRGERQRRAHALVAAWDGDMRADSAAATVFNVWTRALRRTLVADELRGWWNEQHTARYVRGVADGLSLDTIAALLADGAWCDDTTSADAVESCDEALDAALDAALAELEKLDGGDAEGWAWGGLHQTRYAHVPFSDVNVLRSFFERAIGNGGSPDSVNVASYRPEQGRYVQDFGAALRQVVALGPADAEHWYMNSTGQSGNVVSAHYDDMVEPFRDVAHFRLDGGADATGDVLTLVPGEAAP
jgi:penicillin amidase